jgi:NarL family two-component system sensor histidine kinase LiaS
MVPQKQLDLTPILETQGLLAALEQLKKEIAKTNPIPIHLEADKDVEKLLGQPAQKAIFSIVAETAASALVHAQADNLYLRLHQRGTDVITEVEDDGIGFDVVKVKASHTEEWLDLEERAALVKGKVEIQSAPGKGTKVTVTIPVDLK